MGKVICCQSTGVAEIATALADCIIQMEAFYLAQGHAKEGAIFVEINSAEGFLTIGWDREGGGEGPFGEDRRPVYYLELKALWREAMDHELGQHHFDRQAHFAICNMVQDIQIAAIALGENEPYVFYELFEGSSAAQHVIP